MDSDRVLDSHSSTVGEANRVAPAVSTSTKHDINNSGSASLEISFEHPHYPLSGIPRVFSNKEQSLRAPEKVYRDSQSERRRASSVNDTGIEPVGQQFPPVPTRRASGLDWIVPVAPEVPTKEKEDTWSLPPRPRTVGERLQPTLETARSERTKYAAKARITGLALNIAIGLQVLLGSLITGLSAVTTGKQTAITVSVLGGLATLVAAYLARARGSNEPELSITRTKDLEQFIRECLAFTMDFGHERMGEHDEALNGFRTRFEELLGNASGERKLSPPV